MVVKIIGMIIAGLFGSISEYFRKKELEKQAAQAEALRRHVESMKEAVHTQGAVDEKVREYEAAQAAAKTAEEKYASIKAWNERMKNWGQK
jgi:hypothetical protein